MNNLFPFLIIMLIIAVYIIYKLNQKDSDNKVINSNNKWRIQILKLKEEIISLELQKEKYLGKGEYDDVKRIQGYIEDNKNKIISNQNAIELNEKYLHSKGFN
jgi:hypothetical protein